MSYDAGPQYAGIGARFGGLIIDGLISIVFAIPAIIALFAGPTEIKTCTVNGEFGLCEVPTAGSFAIAGVLGLAGLVGYLFLFCKKAGQGQSWGMKATGTRLVDAQSGAPIGTGRALGRYLFANFISGNICLLGFLWALWDGKKQTWHDKVVNSIMVKA
jgi:uncharacterized RDD family membrane protein YckC